MAGTHIHTQEKDLLAVREHLRHAPVTSSEVYVDYAQIGQKGPTSDW